MRRSIGLVLLGLGVLLLVLAPLSRWYAYPRLAVVPDEVAERVSSGQDVTVLDRSAAASQDGEVERTTDVRSVRRIVPDANAGTDDVAVWETSVTTIDARNAEESAEQNVLSYVEERVAFDRHGGHALEGRDQYISRTGADGDTEPLEHAGYVFKLPFGTEQRDYEFWDAELRATRPMVFDGLDEREGVEVYRFVQRIDPTPVAQLEVPGVLFDRPGEVSAERLYSTTRTIWVEPRTGAIIDGREEVDSFLRFDGRRGPAVLQGTLAYTDDQVAANVAEYSDTASELRLIRDTVPLAGVVAGAVAAGAGFVLARRRSRPARRRVATVPADAAEAREPADSLEPAKVPEPAESPEPAEPPAVSVEPAESPEPRDSPAVSVEPAKAPVAASRQRPDESAAGRDRGVDDDMFDEFDEDGTAAGSAFRY